MPDRLAQVKHTSKLCGTSGKDKAEVNGEPLHLLYSKDVEQACFTFHPCAWSILLWLSLRPDECVFCVTVQDPCAEQNGGCLHDCRVDGGKAHCDCKVGYLLAEDGKTCEGTSYDYVLLPPIALTCQCVDKEQVSWHVWYWDITISDNWTCLPQMVANKMEKHKYKHNSLIYKSYNPIFCS